jgi:hypothetical protein
MKNSNTHAVPIGTVVLYTQQATRYAAGASVPALVTKVHAGKVVDLCGFGPAPEPAWCIDHDADGKPGTWRHMPHAGPL